MLKSLQSCGLPPVGLGVVLFYWPDPRSIQCVPCSSFPAGDRLPVPRVIETAAVSATACAGVAIRGARIARVSGLRPGNRIRRSSDDVSQTISNGFLPSDLGMFHFFPE
ncbi:MAG TPA: hypothetical protein DCR20_00495 [Planctomycetaceae bacterium]|nr:hypothetical protein [Planctomycetaceae bacterium]